MKKLLFSLLLLLSISPCWAQTCPTRPFGDNSNACASTAFVQAALASGGFVVGPASSTDSDIALFSGTTGKLLKDGGIPLDLSVTNAFPGPGDPSVGVGIVTGHKVAPLDANVVYSGIGVYPFQVDSSNPYVIGYTGTIGSSTVGQTFGITFTSTFLAGSPVTVSYTAIGGDTVSTIATGVCAAVNANANLHGPTGLPLFCQTSGSGTFHLQWQESYTDLTAVAAAGNTGTVSFGTVARNLDYAVSILGRKVPGHVGGANDNIHCLQIMGQSSDGTMDAVVGQLCGSLPTATSGNVTGNMQVSNSLNGVGIAEQAWQSGTIFFDSTGALPTGGYKGRGTINLPTVGSGGVYLAGIPVVQLSGGGASGAGLVSLGTPAAIAMKNTAGGVDQKGWDWLATGTTLAGRAYSDNEASANPWVTVTRSGITISSVAFGAATSAPSFNATTTTTGYQLGGVSVLNVVATNYVGFFNLNGNQVFLAGDTTGADPQNFYSNDTQCFRPLALGACYTTLSATSATFAQTTASSSHTTGSGIFGGGVGVGGDVWASGNYAVDSATKTLLLKRGANGAVGTFVCTGAGTITISNTNVATSDTIIISMATAGGTITTPPAFKTITAATGFTVLCGGTDTSTYNYGIIKNAA